MSSFNRGDKVTWSCRYGRAQGKIVRRIERDTQLQGHTIRASKDNPQYLVESEKTGTRATLKPDSLDKI